MLAQLSLLALVSVSMAAPIVDATVTLPNTTQSSNVAWYYQNNAVGACGNYSLDTDLVVGLPSNLYNSSYCGDYVVLKSPVTNGTVVARIEDASATTDLILLSVATWTALNGTSDDLSTVEWRFATANETAAAAAALSTAAAPLSTSYVASAAAAETPVVSATYVAPTTTSTYVAPTTKSSSTYVAPVATTTSTYVEPTTTKKTTSSPAYTPTTTSTSVYVAPTTTYVQAAATTKAASSSSSGSYSGQATFFYQNGQPGACGNYNSDSAYNVAIDIDMWNGGANCGRTVVITGNGKTISATVADECPTCASSGSLDLSVGAFNALASESDGVASITWYFA